LKGVPSCSQDGTSYSLLQTLAVSFSHNSQAKNRTVEISESGTAMGSVVTIQFMTSM